VTVHFQSTPLAAPAFPDPAAAAERRRVAFRPQLVDAMLAHGDAQEQLERLRGGALCVTTGQQPGLLTGPLFTVYKALTAVALAESLSARLGEPVVPVFWVAGDDHDLAEANHVHYLTRENDVRRVSLPDRAPDAPLTPLYREPLGSEVVAVIAELAADAPDTEFRADVLRWLERHYRGDADFATAFAGALAELLGRFGLVVFQPTHPAAKRAMAPLLLDTLRVATALDRDLGARAAELQASGRPAPVTAGDGATGVMVEGRLGRDRLVLEGDTLVARRSGEAWSLAQLERVAADDPERLSPNVLLRPALEAGLLPTVAYVGGPGELAYLPQADPNYRVLGLEPQVPFPRWSARLVEQRVTKVLAKYGVTADDLLRADLETVLIRDDMPDDVRAPLTGLRTALGQQYQRLQDAVTAVDPTLKKSVQSTRNSALADLTDLEKRIVAHLKKQNEIVVQQIGKARNSVYPGGQPQERMFTIAPYLIRYGTSLLDAALDAARAHVHRAMEP
jgi:bacillithiol biosynthesis cysteine-adding enzyme BshC